MSREFLIRAWIVVPGDIAEQRQIENHAKPEHHDENERQTRNGSKPQNVKAKKAI